MENDISKPFLKDQQVPRCTFQTIVIVFIGILGIGLITMSMDLSILEDTTLTRTKYGQYNLTRLTMFQRARKAIIEPIHSFWMDNVDENVEESANQDQVLDEEETPELDNNQSSASQNETDSDKDLSVFEKVRQSLHDNLVEPLSAAVFQPIQNFTTELFLGRNPMVDEKQQEKSEQQRIGVNDKDFVIPLVKNRTYAVGIYVRTANSVKELGMRKIIRETWGKQAVELGMFVLFIAALQKNVDVKAALKNESDKYNDIVVFDDFYDSYSNLSLKTRDEMRYHEAHQPKNAPSIHIWTNNDGYLFPKRILKYIDAHNVDKVRNTIYGHCTCQGSCPGRGGPGVMRGGKWAMPASVYPWSRYPHYCFGYSVMFSPGCTKELARVANNKTDQWLMANGIDDVTYGGILRNEAGLKMTKAPFVGWDIGHGPDTLAIHLAGSGPDRIKKMWDTEGSKA